MHSTVYELSTTPVPKCKRVRASNLPEWFYFGICDYAENVLTEAGRKSCIDALMQRFHGLCTAANSKLKFMPEFRTKYFQESYQYFRSALDALVQTDYSTFSGSIPAPAFHAAMRGITESYDDKHDIYIYTPKTDELHTLDSWLRETDLSTPFYVGGVVDYHY